ncbi:hypothetical protein F0562_034088 [Nyssa sinensis]|uniref:Uncharacterized protein n=1 Tax=Nyssa sinensis TaxID=561372 RepID=A0A5J5ADR4_9ASTE|nr:hypothetical protein F0562_034088 [Nyssa sinensis]
MSDQGPDWDFTSVMEDDDYTDRQLGPNHGDVSVLPDSSLAEQNLQLQTPSAFCATEMDNYSDIFKVLSDVELRLTPPEQATTSVIHFFRV